MNSPRKSRVDLDKHEVRARRETRCIAEVGESGNKSTRPSCSAGVNDVAH
jgi:hypothetical protein